MLGLHELNKNWARGIFTHPVFIFGFYFSLVPLL